MRKVLLFASALCLAGNAMAQTEESPLTAVAGNNTHTLGGDVESASVFWEYKATDDSYWATVGDLNNSYIVPKVYLKKKDGSLAEMRGITTQYPSSKYTFQKGETYVFKIENARGGNEKGFSLSLETTSVDFSAGLTEENPIKIELGKEQFFGDQTSSTNKLYATYTATESGQLRLTSSQYLSFKVTANGKPCTVSRDNATNSSIIKCDVEAGKTYSIVMENCYSPFFATSSIVQVKAGSLDAPFSLNDKGDNTVPNEVGKYYFTYTPQEAGYLELSSEKTLPGGTVKVYDSESSMTYDNPKATSEQGSYNLRMEIPYASGTYYIVVDKLQKAEGDSFKATMTAYQPGETEATAIDLSEMPTAAQTLPKAVGTYYYKFVVPENTKKFIEVKAVGSLKEATAISLYQQYYTYNAVTMKNGVLKNYVENSYEVTYFLKVEAKEETPLSFTVSYVEPQEGSLITNPKQISAEDIDSDIIIDMDGEEYFEYTATKDGKLSVSVDDVDATVSFPKGTGPYDGNYETTKSNGAFWIKATSGTKYLIKVSGVAENTTMTLEETEFKAGETREKAIVMKGDEYAFTKMDEAADLWLEYDVTEDGTLDFTSDLIYVEGANETITIYKNDESRQYTMIDTGSDGTAYKGKITVSQGDKLYIHCKVGNAKIGDSAFAKIQFAKHEAQPGETLATALVLEKGQSVDILGATPNTPVWVKVDFPAGETQLKFNDYAMAYVYKSLEDAKAESNAGYMTTQPQYEEGSYTPVQDEDGNVYLYTQSMSEAGTVYYQFIRCNSSSVKMTYLSDSHEAQPGETQATAIELGELPVEKTVETKGTTYYKFTVPANANKKYVVISTSNESLDANTVIKFYDSTKTDDASAVIWNGQTVEKKWLGNSTEDVTYIVKVESNEESPLTFKLSYENVKGTSASDPKAAGEGDNFFDFDGTVYFAYPAAKNGELSVIAADGQTVTFPKDATEADSYVAEQKGTKYVLKATAGTTYLIKVEGAKTDGKFSLDFVNDKGYEAADPQKANLGENTVDLAGTEFFTYTAAQTGKLIVKVGEGVTVTFPKSVAEGADNYEATEANGEFAINVTAGTAYLVKVEGAQVGAKFTIAEVALGDKTNPVEIAKGQEEVEFPIPTANAPVWVEANLPAGVTEVVFNACVTGSWYKSIEDAEMHRDGKPFMATPINNARQTRAGSAAYSTKIDLGDWAGKVYIVFDNAYEMPAGETSVKMAISNTATGIYSIEAIAEGKVSVYKADGTKVDHISGAGMYIIKQDGKTKKFMIKK